MLVVKSILALPSLMGGEHEYSTKKVLPILTKLLPLFKNYVKSPETQKDCLIALEEFALANSDNMSSGVLVKVIHYLYDKEVLAEQIILRWVNHPSPLSEWDLVEQQHLRKGAEIQLFKRWLEEAEEESSDE